MLSLGKQLTAAALLFLAAGCSSSFGAPKGKGKTMNMQKIKFSDYGAKADGSANAAVRLTGSGTLTLGGHSYPDSLVPGYTVRLDASAPGAVTAEARSLTAIDRSMVTFGSIPFIR